MSRDITKAVPLLQEFFPKLAMWYSVRYPGKMLLVTHVDRTPVEQLKLFCQGRLPEYPGSIVTYKDGFVQKSMHNAVPATAIDVGIVIGGKTDWSEKEVLLLAPAIKDLGYEGKIVWGGTWKMKDNYHFQIV